GVVRELAQSPAICPRRFVGRGKSFAWVAPRTPGSLPALRHEVSRLGVVKRRRTSFASPGRCNPALHRHEHGLRDPNPEGLADMAEFLEGAGKVRGPMAADAHIRRPANSPHVDLSSLRRSSASAIPESSVAVLTASSSCTSELRIFNNSRKRFNSS